MNHDFIILLAEDSEDDVFLLNRAFKKAGLTHPLEVVHDGEAAIAYLRGERQYADRERYPLPGLVVLDIKMPKKSGLEVLEWMRKGGEDGFNLLPVVIMSSSQLQTDINQAYELGVNAYLVKPSAFEALTETLKTMTHFWKDTAALPQI